MKSANQRVMPLILFVGIALVVIGILFTPSFGAKYVKRVDSLAPSQVLKVISYQLYAVTSGFLIISISLFIINRKYLKFLGFPLIIIYLLLVHVIYINVRYPDNAFLKPKELKKAWNVLLGTEFVLRDYTPRSSLVVENKKISKAKYPVIDVHFHFGSLENMKAEDLIKSMDACGIKIIANLDGDPGDFEKYKKDFVDKYPDRLKIFTRLKLYELYKKDFVKTQTALLEQRIKEGAIGLKVTKGLGLGIKDEKGRLVAIDDPRLEAIWDKASELGVPVLMHVGDPTPFFHAIDRFNERYEELKEFPEWSFHGPPFPTKEALLAQRDNLLKKHPKTIFIGAHLGDSPEDLAYVGRLLDTYPNYYVDMSSRLPELGRQPFTARKFFIKYQDRILFGSDGGYGFDPKGPWSAERIYRTHFEFFETTNEYFEYPLWGIQKQGRWRIYGIDLPDQVLEKIYHKNAEKLLFKKSG